jgi:uncharacterized protein (DUF362 family)
MKTQVGIVIDQSINYPKARPFHPDAVYPELTFLRDATTEESSPNPVYEMIRNCFYRLGLDATNYGTPAWNPLGAYVSKGDTVVIKPNFVLDEREEQQGKNCLITHGSVIRTVIDYVYLAGAPSCKIIIADAPIQSADFDSIIKQSGVNSICRYYKENLGYEIIVNDLRKEQVILDRWGFIKSRYKLKGDINGYKPVQLGQHSELEPLADASENFRVTDYHPKKMHRYHSGGSHEYLLSGSVLAADTIINVPKLKTHQKTGISVCIKNIVGVNGDKDRLPHYRIGAPEEGGDEYPRRNYYSVLHRQFSSGTFANQKWVLRYIRVLRALYKGVRQLLIGNTRIIEAKSAAKIANGAWYGNDTIWRMVIDINKAVKYANKWGDLENTQNRKLFSIIDGIIAGEGNGPLKPKPKKCGMIMAGEDPLSCDAVCAHLMGFEWQKISLLKSTQKLTSHPISRFTGQIKNIKINPSIDSDENWRSLNFHFEPSPGWKGYIER